MAFDAAVVKCFVNEAYEKIIDAKIEKVHQPQKDEIVLALRTRTENFKLYISANPSYPRIFLTSKGGDNPLAPPMFCMLLRKHLTSGRIVNVYQSGFERIIVFEIEGYDELMEPTVRKLIVEIMGKHSNIILTDAGGRIIDSIKRIDISTSSVRQVLPSLDYQLPPVQEDKLNPVETDFSTLDAGMYPDVERFMMSTFYGISKLTAREVEYEAEKIGLNPAMEKVLTPVRENRFLPCIIYGSDGQPVDFSAIDINQFGCDYTKEYNESISYIVEKFYTEKALRFRISQNTANLMKVVTNNIERCRKKLAIFKKQLLDSAKRDTYRKYGELITANLYSITENCRYAEVVDYYDESCPVIKITLDEALTPAQNAAKYFAKYNKAKTAEEQAYIQISSAEKELEYLETVADEISRVSGIAEIKEIKDELVREGYIKEESGTKRAKESVSAPKSYDIDGYTVYVGKNNRQNDILTLKTARSRDMWLHTKNIPGSHVIIVKKDGEEIPDTVIEKAAQLAAINSKAGGRAKTPVDYTEVKNVKKPSGAKPGMVIYDHYNTIYVN